MPRDQLNFGRPPGRHLFSDEPSSPANRSEWQAISETNVDLTKRSIGSIFTDTLVVPCLKTQACVDPGSYVTVFQNRAPGLTVGTNSNVHHGPSQIVGRYH